MNKPRVIAWTVVLLALLAGSATLLRQRHLRTVRIDETLALDRKIATARTQLAHSERKCSALALEVERAAAASPAPRSAPAAKPPSPADVLEAQRAAMRSAMAQAFRQMLVSHEMWLERYLHPKFNELRLTAEQWARYKQANLELLRTRNDATLRGVRGEELATLTKQAEDACNAALREALGDATVAAIREFDAQNRRADERAPGAVRELSNVLLFTSAPLQPDQAQRLIALVESAPSYNRNAGVGDTTSGVGDRATAPIQSATILAEAQRILTPTQMEAFRRWATAYDHVNEVDTIVRQQAFSTQATIGLPKK